MSEKPSSAGQELLSRAEAAHRAGDLAQAGRLYDEALRHLPQSADAHLKAGMLAYQGGALALAHARIARSIELGDDAQARFVLGNIEDDTGRPAEAAGQYRQATRLKPDFVEAWNNLGIALGATGRVREARAAYRSALAVRPVYAEAWLSLARGIESGIDDAKAQAWANRARLLMPRWAMAHFVYAETSSRLNDAKAAANGYAAASRIVPGDGGLLFRLGLALSASGRAAEAARAFRRSAALAPEIAAAWFHLGEAAREREDWSRAETVYRRTLAIEATHVLAITHLGNVLDEMERYDEAMRLFAEGLVRAPLSVELLSNHATGLMHLARFGEARNVYRRVVCLAPDHALAHFNLANAHRQFLELDRSLVCYGRAVAIDPGYGTAHWNTAVTHLMRGDWDRGWALYDWRLKDRKIPLPAYAPWWQGEPLAGRRIVLLAEQGQGDMIHFARYARLVAAQGARVVLECYPSLTRLFRTLGDDVELLPAGQHPGAVDYQIGLPQLPRLFATRPDTAWHVPYLRPSADGPSPPELDTDAFKVALVWAGNPRIEKIHKRSARLEDFAPLLDVPGVRAYSLQVGPRQADIAALGLSDRIVDLAPHAGDFMDTATLVSKMDLVIAVDTSTAHVAGAIGVPVWMLTTYIPDWRWMLGRDDTPWYPTMRLFRQTVERSWPETIGRVRQALLSEVAARPRGR